MRISCIKIQFKDRFEASILLYIPIWTPVNIRCLEVSKTNGTDKDIFGDDEPVMLSSNGGRPALNRDLARRLFLAGFTPSKVAKKLGCHPKTAQRIRRELEESGDLEKEERQDLSIVQADFDDECRMAIGISYINWLKGKTVKSQRIFNFCQRTWVKVWGRPSLVVVAKDRDSPLGDQLCQKFIDVFGEDKARIRGRKKLIRYLFRFLGRQDLCDRFLTMTKSRDPREIKKLPEIEFPDFPLKLDQVLDSLNHDPQKKTALRFKICTQMRTGKASADRGLMGMKVGGGSPSWLIMNDPDSFRGGVKEKANRDWRITWIPKPIRDELYKICEDRKPGESLFNFDINEIRREFKKLTKKIIGRAMTLHDLRKVSITWLYICRVPLERATMLNVGWDDLNTPRDHYLQIGDLMKKSERLAYLENIPDWFKEGLDEYAREKE